MAHNVLHKTSSGIGSSTLSTAKNLINCTALTKHHLNRYWFYAVLANVFMILKLEIDIKINDFDTEDKVASINYPNEGNFITISKGLNVIELSDAIYHEIGHLIDWYISNENQSKNVEIREENANIIGECLRFRESSNVC